MCPSGRGRRFDDLTVSIYFGPSVSNAGERSQCNEWMRGMRNGVIAGMNICKNENLRIEKGAKTPSTEEEPK